MTELAIREFSGPNRFLSNFYPSKFVAPLGWDLPADRTDDHYYEMVTYPTAEHYYQACKAGDPAAVRMFVQVAKTPAEAKRLGRRLEVRPDWEAIKLNVMRSALFRKFRPGTELAERLLETGDALLEEGNTWGDTFWGVCRGRGYNWLGHLLMAQRAYLRSSLPVEPESQGALF